MFQAPLYHQKASPGKGHGLFASAAISKGTRILSETPLVVSESPSPLVIHLQLQNLSRKASQQRERFDNLHHVGHLPAPPQMTQQRTPFHNGIHPTFPTKTRMNMYVQFLDESNWEAVGQSGTPRRIVPHLRPADGGKGLAIFDNNCFCIKTAAGEDAWAVFEHASRLNHSCFPNCYAAWNRAIGRLCVHAIRDIEEGKELFIAYRAPTLIFEQPDIRSRELHRMYGFTCGCPACTIHLDSVNEHRARRERIAELMHQISVLTAADGTVSVEAKKQLDEALDLMEDEGLETLEKARRHEQLASVCKIQGRPRYNDVVFHLWQAKNIAETCLGNDHEETRRVDAAYMEMIFNN